MRLSVAVMHHPSRAEDLGDLLTSLAQGAPGGGAHVRVVTDEWGRGVWPVARAAWRASHPLATHHLVIQDDVLPCREFLLGAEQALEAKPHEVVSFFCGRKVQTEAVSRNLPWCTMGSISMAQAVAMPVHLVDEWLTWCDQWVRPEYRHDDARLSLWVLHHARKVWYTCPSLVEHIGWDRGIAGNPKAPGGRPRVAAEYIGSNVSPRGIHWARQLVGVPHDAGVSVTAYKGWRRT